MTTLPFNFSLFRDIYLAGSPSLDYDERLPESGKPFRGRISKWRASGSNRSAIRRGGDRSHSAFVDCAVLGRPCDEEQQHGDDANTLAIAPNRQFVVEWSNMSILDDNGKDLNASLTFEAVLFEGSNDIQFLYRSMTGPRSDGSSATDRRCRI